MDPMTSMELGLGRLDDLRAEARAHAVEQEVRSPGGTGRVRPRVRTKVGAALIALGARLTQEQVTRAELRGPCASE